MEVTLGGACDKSKDDSISHTCEKPDDECILDAGLGFHDAANIGNVADGYKRCQMIPVNGVAEFLLKDANGSCDTYTKTFGDHQAVCSTYTNDAVGNYGTEHCSGNGNQDKECVWRIDAPTDCNNGGGSFGDPHIKRWNRKTFDFHGECDLVLVHSDHVNGGDELDLHIRTTIQSHWSSVTSAALRVGQVTLQMDTDKFYVDGIEYNDAALPLKTTQFTISEVTLKDGARIYVAELNDKSSVTFKVIKEFLTVAVSGHAEDFEHSVGLLGDFHLGKPYGRDGERIYDFNEYGLEWQVREEEPMLFVEAREPQLPNAKCRFPDEPRPRRHLKSSQNPALFEKAQSACANREHYDACLDDVMYTGEVALAAAW